MCVCVCARERVCACVHVFMLFGLRSTLHIIIGVLCIVTVSVELDRSNVHSQYLLVLACNSKS